MKKIMMMVAVTMAAIAVNAASCNWTITNVKTPDDPSVAGSGYSVYLFATAVGGSLSYNTTTIAAITAAIDDGTFDTSKAIATGTTGTTGGIAGDTGLGGSFGAGDSLTGFAVIFDGGYDSTSGGNYIVTAEKTANWTSTTGMKTLAFGSMASAPWTAYGVPEPTSALLLVLGMAGLALKRKVA